MIIVEGPDGGGKTTLIAQLVGRWQLPVAPRVVSKNTEAMTDLKTWVERNNEAGWQPTIFDRHRLISETIYGPIMRPHEPEPGFDQVPWLMWQMHKFYSIQPLVIYCLPPLDVVRQNVQGEDNAAVRTKIDQIYNLYLTRAAIDYATRERTTAIYDYTTDGQEENPTATFGNWDRIIEARRDW